MGLLANNGDSTVEFTVILRPSGGAAVGALSRYQFGRFNACVGDMESYKAHWMLHMSLQGNQNWGAEGYLKHTMMLLYICMITCLDSRVFEP